MLDFLNEHDGVKSIKFILQAGDGEIIGRTRLQKIAYLLNLSGYDDSFEFEYKHYGPFSREVAQAAKFAELAGVLHEDTKPTSWGGTYSIFKLIEGDQISNNVIERGAVSLVEQATNVNSVALELAATAAFLSSEYSDRSWEETKRRKPRKATAINIKLAKDFYRKIQVLDTPAKLPELV